MGLELLSAFVSALLAAGWAAMSPGSNPFFLVICAVAWQVFVTFIALVIGLVASNTVLSPKTVASSTTKE